LNRKCFEEEMEMDNRDGPLCPDDLDRLLRQAFTDPRVLSPTLAEAIERTALQVGKTPLRRKARGKIGTWPTTTGGP